jgi:hypothetical protein
MKYYSLYGNEDRKSDQLMSVPQGPLGLNKFPQISE